MKKMPKMPSDSPVIYGNCSNIYGDCSKIYGDCSNLSGNCTGVFGCVTGISVNLDDCEITDEQRLWGIDILDLIN